MFSAAVTLLIIVSLTFILMHALPGGPFDGDKKLPDAIMKNLNERYRLNEPVWVQYRDYLRHLAHGDLGPSYRYETRSVNDLIKAGFPYSAALGGVVMLAALAGGVLIGAVSALYHNRWQDHAGTVIAVLGLSLPSFVIAGIVSYVFAVRLHWFPPALWEGPRSLVLPALSLAGLPAAVIARLVRTGLLKEMQQDYILLARAKGLSARTAMLRHALRVALMPVLSYLGPAAASILTGSFVVEHIFAIPGLGKWFVNGVINRDYTLVLGLTVFYSALLLVINFLVDVIRAMMDPRIKLWKARG